MRALVIAIGNPMRRDDGVAHSIRVPAGATRRDVLQLTPEIAVEIASYDTVVFLDADVDAKQVRIEPVEDVVAPVLLTHVLKPCEIVALARVLFEFSGQAYTCRIPVSDLTPGEGLSLGARQFASGAAREISSFFACKQFPAT